MEGDSRFIHPGILYADQSLKLIGALAVIVCPTTSERTALHAAKLLASTRLLLGLSDEDITHLAERITDLSLELYERLENGAWPETWPKFDEEARIIINKPKA